MSAYGQFFGQSNAQVPQKLTHGFPSRGRVSFLKVHAAPAVVTTVEDFFCVGVPSKEKLHAITTVELHAEALSVLTAGAKKVTKSLPQALSRKTESQMLL